MERGKTEKSAIAELSSTFDFKGTSIVNMEEVTNYLSKEKSVLDKDKLDKIADYYKQYGAKN